MIDAAPFAQIHRRILPGKCDENATSCRSFAGVRERRDEEGVAGQRALCALRTALPSMPPPCALGSRVVFMTMPSCMYIIAPASAMHHLAGIERDDDCLEVVANQLVVDFVGHWLARSVAGCW